MTSPSPRRLKFALACTALVTIPSALPAVVNVPAIFSDHMVLQASASTPVWGTADAGERITVTLGDGMAAATATAGADGRWRLSLDLANAPRGPHRLVIRGTNTIEINDVVIGQVWLAGGQSNMAFRLNDAAGAGKDIATTPANWLREFKVSNTTATEPQSDLKGKWVVATAQNAGNFSAVGYYFARGLHEELQQPVGIIASNLGATPIEAWMSQNALARDEELAAAVKRRHKQIDGLPARRDAYIRALTRWSAANSTEDAVFAPPQQFAAVDADLSGWTKVRLNGSIEIKGENLPARGVIWLRRDVDIPAKSAGRPLSYRIQSPRGLASYYWNGERIDGPPAWQAKDMTALEGVGAYRVLTVPAALVKEGKNVVAIRIYAPTHPARNGGNRHDIHAANGFRPQMGGRHEWLAKAETAFALAPEALRGAPALFTAPDPDVQQPARLFNAMIAPLAPYAVAGVIWYQGESNVSRAEQYRRTFRLLIEDWREHWENNELPFYFCQLANYGSKQTQPLQSSWAELRESQSFALALPHTAQAVAIDLGEAGDIHPRNKRDVGERLARIALRQHYGKTGLVASGPVYEQQTIEGNTVRLRFKDDGGGSELTAAPLPQHYPLKSLNNTTRKLELPRPKSQLQGFAICGADGKWVWADARIETAHTVAVSSPEVPHPVAVRYAWADNPTANLANTAGLPASPFRTDDFALATQEIGY